MHLQRRVEGLNPKEVPSEAPTERSLQESIWVQKFSDCPQSWLLNPGTALLSSTLPSWSGHKSQDHPNHCSSMTDHIKKRMQHDAGPLDKDHFPAPLARQLLQLPLSRQEEMGTFQSRRSSQICLANEHRYSQESCGMWKALPHYVSFGITCF